MDKIKLKVLLDKFQRCADGASYDCSKCSLNTVIETGNNYIKTAARACDLLQLIEEKLDA